MPTLPPRNLPFSPGKASPQNTPPKRNDRQSSPANTGTPVKRGTSDGSGILPRQEETTFHRRLRSILWDHRSGCERWEDVVSLQGAKVIASIARLSATLDDLLSRQFREESEIVGVLRLEKEEGEARRMDEMGTILRGMEMERTGLQEIMCKVTKATSKLEALSDAAEGLLVEATRLKGSDFTFEQEMWVTWTMERFVGIIHLITSRHVLQTEHLQALSKLLLEEGCAPGGSIVSSKETERYADKEEEEEEEDSDKEDIDEEGRAKRKRRARVRERVMEEWQALELLQEEDTGIDSEWFEDVCEVEVGRWDDR